MMAAVLLAGCGGGGEEKGMKKGGAPLLVDFMVTALQPVDHTLGFAGSLLANEEVVIQPEITGRIVAIHFTEGARVSKGDLMVKTDDAELQAQLRQNDLQQELAEGEWQRRRELLAAKGISQEELDGARVRYESLKATHDLLMAQIARTEIRAPFSGSAGLRQVSEESVVTPSTIITTLQQTNPIKVEFAVPEQFASELKPGVPITFTSESSAGEWSTTLYAVEPRIDPLTRTITGRARCANPGNSLVPGSFARVKLSLASGKTGIMIPARAIIPVLNGQQVYVIVGGKAEPRDVSLGRRSAEAVEVISGLQPGDSVVMSGLLQLKPGTPIKPKTTGNQPPKQP